MLGQAPADAVVLADAIEERSGVERQRQMRQEHIVLAALDLAIPGAMRVVGAEHLRGAVVHARVVDAVVEDDEVEVLLRQGAVFQQAVARGVRRRSQVEDAHRSFQRRFELPVHLLLIEVKGRADD